MEAYHNRRKYTENNRQKVYQGKQDSILVELEGAAQKKSDDGYVQQQRPKCLFYPPAVRL